MLHIFGRYFFPHIIKSSVPICHIELINELTSINDSAIIFPRGFAKSTWVKLDTLHDIVYGLEPVILYISDTLQSATFHFESIKSELENNQLLRSIYGNLVPKLQSRESVKWTNTHFETTNDVNVVARGANKGRGVNIKNNRPTKAIIDDAETDEQVNSSMRRRKFHDWLYNVIIPSLDPIRGRFKAVGTIIHPECEVLKVYEAKGGIFKQATHDGTLNSQSIWPDYMPVEFLIKIRDGYIDENGKKIEGIGTRAFNQEYMNNPISDDMANIKPEWIDDNFFTVLPSSRTRMNKVITIDPQSGDSNSADEYAITVLAWYNGDSHRYVVEQRAGRASQMQQTIELIRTWLDHKDASVVAIEKVMTQVAVYQLAMQWKNGSLPLEGLPDDDRNIPIRSIVPDGKTGGILKNKLQRFKMHEAMIERGELHLRPEMTALREQIFFLGTTTIDHDDRVDSLIMALDLSYKHNPSENRLEGMTQKTATTAGNLLKAQF